MARRAYQLDFYGPLHVGRAGVGFEESLDYLPSDTLFAALVVTWLEMGEASVVEQLDADFAPGHTPPLLLSSAFPYVGDLLLLPKPQLARVPASGGKGYKRLRWVSAAVFQQLSQGIGQDDLDKLWAEAQLVQGGTVWITKQEQALAAAALGKQAVSDLNGWGEQKVPHVAVDRISSASNLYYVGQTHFATGCGLWLLVEAEDEVWLSRLHRALELLQDSGLGGRRSRGGGHFTLAQIDPPSLGTAGRYQMLLSRLAPTTEQMTLLKQPLSRYELVTVGGYSDNPRQTPVIRKRVRMLKEGSIIASDGGVPGKLVDVKPSATHDSNGKPLTLPSHIYRYGFGFGIPVDVSG